jgi:hypothetical protein
MMRYAARSFPFAIVTAAAQQSDDPVSVLTPL